MRPHQVEEAEYLSSCALFMGSDSSLKEKDIRLLTGCKLNSPEGRDVRVVVGDGRVGGPLV